MVCGQQVTSKTPGTRVCSSRNDGLPFLHASGKTPARRLPAAGPEQLDRLHALQDVCQSHSTTVDALRFLSCFSSLHEQPVPSRLRMQCSPSYQLEIIKYFLKYPYVTISAFSSVFFFFTLNLQIRNCKLSCYQA